MHEVADRNRSFNSRAALVLTACWFTVLLTSTYAQTGSSTVRGTIFDQQGNVVSGATITLESARKEFSRTQLSNDDGGYVFKGVSPDTYTIQVVAANFRKSVVQDVRLEMNLSVEVNIRLELGRSDISKDAPVRERVRDIKPPIVEAEPASSLSLCGSRSYLVKDAAGGYFMFTMHTSDMPNPITVDNPLLSLESWRSVDKATTFAAERPLGSAEQELLVKLLQEWRNSAIPREKLRMFKHYSGLKSEAAFKKWWDSLSRADSDLLDLWFVIKELQKKRN